LPDAVARTVDNRLFIVCGLAWGAGLVHVHSALAQRGASVAYAVVFAVLAVAQFLWGVAVYRWGGRRLVLIGAVASLGVAAAWIASQTSGLPFGIQPASAATPFHPFECFLVPASHAGPVDTLATGDEIAIALLVGVYVFRRRGSWTFRAFGAATTAAGLWLILLSSMSIAATDHVH
jgi:hypothetical protein